MALGYADDTALIQKALELMTDGNEPFSPLEKWFLLNALQTHRPGAAASWDWLKAKWGAFGRAGTVTVSRYIASCTSSLSMAEQLVEVKALAGVAEVSFFCLSLNHGDMLTRGLGEV